VLQPEKVKTPEFVQELKAINPDIIITAAYGKILPKEILDIPPLGCINVHGSLLPKYRGAAPIHWAIINGEKTTGITTMYTDAGLDTGDMLLKSEIVITDDMTAGELHDRMAALGAETLKETLIRLEEGRLERTPQNHKDASYAPLINKDTGRINWADASDKIYNLIRGTNPWPVAFTYYKGDRMRIWKARHDSGKPANFAPGTITEVGKGYIEAVCGSGSLIIEEIQFGSSRRMSVEEYLRGHVISEGEVFG
jgi:methionyl-tRNA formyltransferase